MKNLILTLSILIFTSSAFAGSCPMMAKGIDAKIAEAQELRDAGMKAHDSGDHAKSEELLGKALEMFKGQIQLGGVSKHPFLNHSFFLFANQLVLLRYNITKGAVMMGGVEFAILFIVLIAMGS